MNWSWNQGQKGRIAEEAISSVGVWGLKGRVIDPG